jgi:hypothetical protein
MPKLTKTCTPGIYRRHGADHHDAAVLLRGMNDANFLHARRLARRSAATGK